MTDWTRRKIVKLPADPNMIICITADVVHTYSVDIAAHISCKAPPDFSH